MGQTSANQGLITDSPFRKLWLRRALALTVVLVVAAAVRVWLAADAGLITKDGIIYLHMARLWASDPMAAIDAADYPPGYPAVVASVHRATAAPGGSPGRAGWELAGRTVSIVAGVAGVAAVWAFAGLAMGWRVAWAAALLMAVAKKFSIAGSDVVSDSLALALQGWAMVLALLSLRQMRLGQRRALLSAASVGLLGGLGYLVRPESLLVVALGATLWLVGQFRRKHSRRLALTGSVLAGVVAVAAALPYMLAIGGFSKKKGLDDFAAAAAPEPVQASLLPLAAGWMKGLDKFIDQIFEAMHPVPGFLMLLWLITWIGWRVLRLRLPREVRLAPRPAAAFLMLSALGVMGVVLIRLYTNVGYISHRHLFLVAALLACLSGAQVVIIMEWLRLLADRLGRLDCRRRLWRGTVRATASGVRAIAWAAPVLLAAGMLSHTFRGSHQGKDHYRQAAAWLEAHAAPSDYILADSPWVPYYADRPGEATVYEHTGCDWLRLRLQEPDVTYVSLSTLTTLKSTPAMAAELSSAGFAEVVCFENGRQGERADTIRVYRRSADTE